MSQHPQAQPSANSVVEKTGHATATTHSLPSHPLQQSYPSSSVISQPPQNLSQTREHPPHHTGVESGGGGGGGAKMKSPQSPRSGGNSPTPPPGRGIQQQQQQHGISYVHGTTAMSPRKKSCESPRGGIGSPRTPRTNRAAQVRLQR